jgi:integrase
MSEPISLNQMEAAKLLDATKTARNKAIITLGVHHGFRSSEIAVLQMSDIDLRNNLITVKRGKGSETNVHSILQKELPVLLAALAERPADASGYVFVSQKGGRLTRSQIFRILQQSATRAGLHKSKRHFHCCRHTGAMTLLRSGAPLNIVQKWGGWRSLGTVGRYLGVSDQTASEAASKAFEVA